ARLGESGRNPAAADLQSGRRLRELCRAGGLRADPAPDAPDRRIHADRDCAGTAWRRRVCDRSRPWHRAPDDLFARAGALLHRAAALIRLLYAGPSAATLRARV